MNTSMKTAADIMLDVLYDNGVRHVFGIPGGNSIPIYDALTHHPLELILTRHEQGATHMADGYARSSGKIGVVCVTSGPGATNTLTGILTAMMDSVPMLVITGPVVYTQHRPRRVSGSRRDGHVVAGCQAFLHGNRSSGHRPGDQRIPPHRHDGAPRPGTD